MGEDINVKDAWEPTKGAGVNVAVVDDGIRHDHDDLRDNVDMTRNHDYMYVGLCAEFGLLSHLDDTPEGAFAGIRDVVAFAVSSLHEDGDPTPEPLSTRRYRRYSGTLTLRVPPETHRALVPADRPVGTGEWR